MRATPTEASPRTSPTPDPAVRAHLSLSRFPDRTGSMASELSQELRAASSGRGCGPQVNMSGFPILKGRVRGTGPVMTPGCLTMSRCELDRTEWMRISQDAMEHLRERADQVRSDRFPKARETRPAAGHGCGLALGDLAQVTQPGAPRGQEEARRPRAEAGQESTAQARYVGRGVAAR